MTLDRDWLVVSSTGGRKKPVEHYRYNGQLSRYLDTILEFYDRGISPRRIGHELYERGVGVSGDSNASTICYILHRMGRWETRGVDLFFKARREYIWHLRRIEGLTLAEIGERLGMSQRRVGHLVRQWDYAFAWGIRKARFTIHHDA